MCLLDRRDQNRLECRGSGAGHCVCREVWKEVDVVIQIRSSKGHTGEDSSETTPPTSFPLDGSPVTPPPQEPLISSSSNLLEKFSLSSSFRRTLSPSCPYQI